MAYTKSGLYLHTFQEVLKATALTGTGGFNLTLNTWKLALVSSSVTDGSSPVNFSTATPSWVNTNEVTGTGWSTGGILLSALAAGSTSAVATLAEGTTGSLRYDHTNDTSVATTTLTNVQGCTIYADPLTAPSDMADAMVVNVCFGSAYSTVAGTFAITWAATGIFEIDMTP
jgi:hypothetical protein